MSTSDVESIRSLKHKQSRLNFGSETHLSCFFQLKFHLNHLSNKLTKAQPNHKINMFWHESLFSCTGIKTDCMWETQHR